MARWISKRVAFGRFTTSLENEETGDPVAFTPEDAEAALAFLVEQGLALVDGDQIGIPEQFIPTEG
jgi:hypothetical protein